MIKFATTTALSLLLFCAPVLASEPKDDSREGNPSEQSMSPKKKEAKESSKPTKGREEPGWVYHLSQAQAHARSLKEQVMIKLANAIEQRGWTQAKTAEFLGVSQPRVSDIMRGHISKFSLDTLVEMLYALDQPVKIVIEDRQWGLSGPNLISAKEAEDKVAYYTKVIQNDPKDFSAYFRRGDAYSELKKYDLAIADFTRCIELDPNRDGPRNARALAYAASKQYKAALQEYDEMEHLFPDSNVYQNRGILYASMGEYDKALVDDTKAIEMDPQRPGPWWNRACLYEKLGKIKEAISDYESTLKADPTYKIAQEKIDELKRKL